MNYKNIKKYPIKNFGAKNSEFSKLIGNQKQATSEQFNE